MMLMKTYGEFLLSDFWPSLLSRAVQIRYLLEEQEYGVQEEQSNIAQTSSVADSGLSIYPKNLCS